MEKADRFGERKRRVEKKKKLFQRVVHTSPDCRWARRFQWISRSLSRECRRAAFTRMRDSHVGHSPSLYFSFLYFIHATPSALSSSLARVNAPMKFNTAGLVRAPNFLNNEKDCISPFHFYYPIKNVESLCAEWNREIARGKVGYSLSKFFPFFFISEWWTFRITWKENL